MKAEISFNYEDGSSNDAIDIRKNATDDISVPEYVNGLRNDTSAYIKNQSSLRIKVMFNSNNSNMNYLVKATVISGTGIGNVCEMFVAPCDLNTTEFTIDIQGTIPSSVGINTFTWKWEATALSINSPYCPITCTSVNTTHNYFTLFAPPKQPISEPRTDILNHAFEWANGETDVENLCIAILNNGFNEHYTYSYNCHELSSDFCRLLRSIGINTIQHKWAAILPSNIDEGDMASMVTRVFAPVGYDFCELDERSYTFEWHQWSEADSHQFDPSRNYYQEGDWGSYEDYFFTHYWQYDLYEENNHKKVVNKSGQSIGCEAPSHRRYYNNDVLLYDWKGPDR